jgi:8-oxo-dGTP diphosphatase
MPIPKQPRLTVDVIIEMEGGVVLVERKFEPLGWAIPGGFVEWGETLETAAIREAKEETGLDVVLKRQFHAYSDPTRDPRGHTVCVVFEGNGARNAGRRRRREDGEDLRLGCDTPPMAFDHAQILDDFRSRRY